MRSRPTLPESPGYLVFVGGVEGDLGHFLIAFAHQLHGAGGQLDALEQGRLGGIAGHIPLWGEGAVRAEQRGVGKGQAEASGRPDPP